MDAATPSVSVLMTVHNAGRFLEPAVRSVLAQTWSSLELIVVDNASDDGALDSLAGRIADPRLRIFRESVNHGIAGGTNLAFSHARGRWIAVMDHDDVAVPHKLERQIAWLEAHPEAGGVAARTMLIDEADRELGGDFTLEAPAEYAAFTAYSQSANFGSHLFRREALEAFPRRAEFSFSSDFDFVARVVERWPVTALPEILFHYRIHAGQTTRVRRMEQLAAEGVIRILTALRRSGRNEAFDQVADWLAEIRESGQPAGMHRACARRCLALELPLLATYHARRSVGAGSPVATLLAGANLCRRAMQADRATAAACARLFLTGPLRFHRLHPWPPR